MHKSMYAAFKRVVGVGLAAGMRSGDNAIEMSIRILNVGVDTSLIETRKLLLASWGFEPTSAYPHDVDEKLATGRFDLVILSVMLGTQEKDRILGLLPAETKALSLEKLVMPAELKKLIAGELEQGISR
jgi:hypothetical protein